VRQEDVDSDYLFGNFLQLLAFRSAPFLNAEYRGAAQMEFVVMIGDEILHPVTKAARVPEFQEFCS
jgi:hypothetical protein